MADLEKLGLIREILGQAESSLAQAKKIISELTGGDLGSQKPKVDKKEILQKAQELAVETGKSRIVQGVFNGQNMVGSDGSEYPVPANYASKSKIVQGDTLKLTISEDGSFIYKQIGPIPRKKIMGVLSQDENGEYQVVADGKTYKVLLASITYFKGEVGDEVTLVVPVKGESEWAAIENIIKKSDLKDMIAKKEMSQEEITTSKEKEEEKEVVPGQVIDNLGLDLEDSLEGLVEEDE